MYGSFVPSSIYSRMIEFLMVLLNAMLFSSLFSFTQDGSMLAFALVVGMISSGEYE